MVVLGGGAVSYERGTPVKVCSLQGYPCTSPVNSLAGPETTVEVSPNVRIRWVEVSPNVRIRWVEVSPNVRIRWVEVSPNVRIRWVCRGFPQCTLSARGWDVSCVHSPRAANHFATPAPAQPAGTKVCKLHVIVGKRALRRTPQERKVGLSQGYIACKNRGSGTSCAPPEPNLQSTRDRRIESPS
ncbi:hypothetical protein T484DRAFT_2907835 [Baffinella frigidus]|nr:hypothetical protein T484DRAFT_2907835 [Cryptophyta sp. CCMP2293]